MAQSPAARPKKHKQDKAASTSTVLHNSPTASPEPSKKKRKLSEGGDAVTSSAEDVSEQAAGEGEVGAAMEEQTLSKAEKGKLKKRRKEEQRALVRDLAPLAT